MDKGLWATIKILFQFLFFTACSSGMAQTGDWATYLARYEKGPGSTLVNMTLKKQAPDSSLPYLFAAGVKFKNCTPDGLPAATAFISLNRISDSIVALTGRRQGTLLKERIISMLRIPQVSKRK